MQLTSLFTKAGTGVRELRPESREEFFATKRNTKRLKISTCFSEPIEKQQQDTCALDLSIDSVKTDDLFKNCKRELESTFGEENVLAFKVKPPKRKKNMRTKPKSELPQGEDSESDGETPLFGLPTSPRLHFSKHSLATPARSKPQPLTERQFSISDFHILSKIGEGTYSEVFKAVQRESGFLVSLKVLQKWKMRELKVQENVIRQIKINCFLEHPNIAKLYSCFHDQDYIYLVCEYATDRNLYETISQPRFKLRKGLLTDQVANIVAQLCSAVKYIHKLYIIHRDIKPENILLTLFNTVKLCDFGWAVYNPSKQMRSTLCGTPLYLAPELVAQNDYDESVDVWAIGVLTYEMLTEESPFKITQMRDLDKILYDEICFEGIRNKVAIEFMQKAMEKDPTKRKSIFQLASHPFLAGENNSVY